jgi:hypothetical protein
MLLDRSGDREGARQLAHEYLARYPRGAHAGAAGELLQLGRPR